MTLKELLDRVDESCHIDKEGKLRDEYGNIFRTHKMLFAYLKIPRHHIWRLSNEDSRVFFNKIYKVKLGDESYLKVLIEHEPNKETSVDELLNRYPNSTLIKTWDELDEYCKSNPSETHVFKFDKYSGWLKPKIKNDDDDWGTYMSTHTFYGLNYRESTEKFQECGFNVVVDNWDK